MGNELDRIRDSSVLSERSVREIDLPRDRINRRVLEDSSEADRAVNFGFSLIGEAQALGVAASLDIEDASLGPTVLIVSDQVAMRIGRESRFAGPGEAEEERDITIRPFIRRAVHREHILLGHDVVHDGEDSLLHLTGVLGAQDHHFAAAEAQGDTRVSGDSGDRWVGGMAARVVDDIVGRTKVLELFGGGPNQHVVHEERVIGPRADDADFDLVIGIPASEAIDHVKSLATVEVVDGASMQSFKGAGRQRDVDRTPPNVIAALSLFDDSLVLRRSPGLGTGEGNDRSKVRDFSFVKGNSVFIEHGGSSIAVDWRAEITLSNAIDECSHDERNLGDEGNSFSHNRIRLTDLSGKRRVHRACRFGISRPVRRNRRDLASERERWGSKRAFFTRVTVSN